MRILDSIVSSLFLTAGIAISPAIGEASVSFGTPSQTFEEAEIAITLQPAVAGQSIIFTIDGSPPTAESGVVYEDELRVSSTTQVRAAASPATAR